MYTIKQAANRTGLSIPTIRAWERRYQVVTPARTPAGYRLYDDAAIERLAAMRTLVEADGWRPSQAAERVLDPDLDLASLVARGPDGRADPTASRPPGLGAQLTTAVPAFVDAAQRLDVDGMERLLDDAFAAQRFELAMDTVVFPALRAVGEAWADGALDIAAEHAASETVRRRLSRFFDAARGPMQPTRVLIGMPPGGQHELGAFAFAVACRRAGQAVAYLGMNVPLQSWLQLARDTAVPAIVLGAVTSDDAAAVDLVVNVIRTMDRPPVCFMGGPAPAGAGRATDAIRLPASLDDAVAAVAMITASVDRRTGR